MVLDEPTAQLDPIGKYEVFKVIEDLTLEGLTTIVVEHEIEELAHFADNIILLHEGKILSYGKAKKVLTEVEKLKAIGEDPPSVTELTYLLDKELDLSLVNYPITLDEAIKIYKELMVSS